MKKQQLSLQDEIDFLLLREKDERQLAAEASSICAYYAHWRLAERYADQAHALSEQVPGPALRSGLWPEPA